MMLAERFKALEEAIAELPPETQDSLAATLEVALLKLRQSEQGAPVVSADVAAAIERALDQHAASLEYLKDK